MKYNNRFVDPNLVNSVTTTNQASLEEVIDASHLDISNDIKGNPYDSKIDTGPQSILRNLPQQMSFQDTAIEGPHL